MNTELSAKSESEPKPIAKRGLSKRNRRRLYVYGGLVALLWGAYAYQPMRIDLIPRHPPANNPPIDPDSGFLFSKNAKVVIVTAHPDDSEFYLGGLLTKLAQSGAQVSQIICTDGDKGYYLWFANPAENRAVRRAEATAALHAWHGKQVYFLGFPDGRLQVSDEVVDAIADKLKAIQPDYVIAFDGDYPPRVSHQDHRRAGEAAVKAVHKTGLGKWLLLFSTIAPNHVFDVGDVWDQRMKLLEIHKSQFHGKRLERVGNMIEESAMDDGARIDATYGEGVRVVKLRA